MARLSQSGMRRRWAQLDAVHLRAEEARLSRERTAAMVSMHRALKIADPIERRLQAELVRKHYYGLNSELAKVRTRLDGIRRELQAD